MTAGELKAAAEAGAEAGEISLRSAREMATAYVSTGKIGGEVMSGLIAITKDYAQFASTDAKGATEELAKAMEDPAKAAREWTRQFGLMDQKTLDHIDSLEKLGDRTTAQKLLLEALTGAVDGHADRVTTISSAWDAAARAVSNYWTKLGEALYTTPEERIAKIEDALQNRPLLLPGARRGLERQLDDLRFQQGYDNAKLENDQRTAAANQAAQEAKDRADAGKKDRDKAARNAERARREAERQARELLQRTRREEDTEASRAREIARLTSNHGETRRLEGEERIRRRIRDLEDGGMATAKARSQALEEDAPLRAAILDNAEREQAALAKAAATEAMRIAGMERFLADATRSEDLVRRTEEYRKAGLGVIHEIAENGIDIAVTDQAAAAARRDMLAIDQARLEVLRRTVEQAEAEHRLNLARLSGDTETARWLDIEDRIERRARDIEGRKGLNYGEGVDEAMNQIQQELDAEATGARRAWLSNTLLDIKRSGLGDAIYDQLDRATDKWLVKLGDALGDLDWGGFLKSLGGGFSSGGFDLGGALSQLFGSGHSAGTDFSEGGWKWVGERGPELLRLPRGSQVMEHDRARQAAAGGGAMNVSLGGLTIKNYGSEPMTGRLSQKPDGGLELELEPLFKSQLAKAGRDGSLARAQRATPQPRRRG